MEAIRQQGKVIEVASFSNQTMSIFDLGMNAQDMLEKWKMLKKQGIRVTLKEYPTIDPYQIVNEDKELMEVIFEFIILTEKRKRMLAKERQAEGIAKARKNGIKLGRRAKVIPDNFVEVYERVIARRITMKKATEILDVDYKTFKKWIQQYKK